MCVGCCPKEEWQRRQAEVEARLKVLAKEREERELRIQALVDKVGSVSFVALFPGRAGYTVKLPGCFGSCCQKKYSL